MRFRSVCGAIVLAFAIGVFVVSIVLGYIVNVEFMVFAFPLFITTLMCGVKCIEPCGNRSQSDELLRTTEEGHSHTNYGTMQHATTDSSEHDSASEEESEEQKQALKNWLVAQATPKPDDAAPSNSELDPKLCIVCLDQPRQMVFRKCGHMCLCEVCSKKIRRCPICQQKGKAIRVFLA